MATLERPVADRREVGDRKAVGDAEASRRPQVTDLRRTVCRLRGWTQDERDPQVDPARRIEAEKGLPLFTNPAGEISGAAGDDARERPAPFQAFGRQLLLGLPPEDEQLRRLDPPRSRRYLIRCNEMRTAADPHTNVAAAVGIESRAVALDGAGRKNPALGDKERAAFGLRMLRLDEGRPELAGEVFRNVDGEGVEDGFALPVGRRRPLARALARRTSLQRR